MTTGDGGDAGCTDAPRQVSKLRWQCRRGMRELDVLLIGYLDGGYEQAGNSEKAAFRAFLALPDPELMSYLLHNQDPPAEFADVVAAILNRPRR